MLFWHVLKNYILWWMVGICIDGHIYLVIVYCPFSFLMPDTQNCSAQDVWESKCSNRLPYFIYYTLGRLIFSAWVTYLTFNRKTGVKLEPAYVHEPYSYTGQCFLVPIKKQRKCVVTCQAFLFYSAVDNVVVHKRRKRGSWGAMAPPGIP